MSDVDKPIGSPAAEEVKDFLRGGKVELDVPTEAIADLKSEESVAPAIAPDQPRIDTPVDPTTDPDNPTQVKMLAWAMSTPDVGEVTVSETEKSLFLKAVLNDEAVSFPVELEFGPTTVKVACRTLGTWEMDVLYNALNEDEKAGLFRDVAQYTTAMQQYVLAMQVTSFNGKPLDYLKFDPDQELSESVKSLREQAKKYVGRWASVRWSAALSALRVFSVKVKLCTDAMLNRDFWSPPGTD